MAVWGAELRVLYLMCFSGTAGFYVRGLGNKVSGSVAVAMGSSWHLGVAGSWCRVWGEGVSGLGLRLS